MGSNLKLAGQLEYGVIYVYTNLYTPLELLNDYMTAMSRACGNPDALHRFKTEVVYADCSPTLVARRFNAGNIGKSSLLTCAVCGDINIDGRLVSEFIRSLFDFGQLDSGDHAIDIRLFLSAGQIRQMREAIDLPDLQAKLDNARQAADPNQTEATCPDMADAEERDLADAERQRKQYLDMIGRLVVNYVSLTHSDPHALLGDRLSQSFPLIFAPQSLSRLVIDADLHIRLADYDDAEIRLHPLSKALYILFLLHPEGIELRCLDEYGAELREIYEIIMPGRDDEATDSIIANVINPLSGTLQQNLSRIKRFFKTVIMDDNTAEQYYITGTRGGSYGIALPRTLVTIPAVFCSDF